MDFTGNLHNVAIAPTAPLIAIPSPGYVHTVVVVPTIEDGKRL
jgi:hypothetical protein